MPAVSNTTPIVYLAKVARLPLLKEVYSTIYLCTPVLQDIEHLAGRGLLEHEAVRMIEQGRRGNWLIQRDPETPKAAELAEVILENGLGLGEAQSIALAKELNVLFLANDRAAIDVARQYNVKTRWFTEILYDALCAKRIKSVDGYITILDECVSKGLYVSRFERDKAVKKAREHVVE